MRKESIKLGPGMALAALKKLYSEEEIVELYDGRRIGTIDIEITDKCNFKCVYCYASCSPLGNPDTEEAERLTKEEIFGVIDQAAGMDIRLFNIQGGEPMLDKELFFEIAEYARPKFKAIVGFTNGSHITEADAIRIKKLGMSLCVKLDTLNPKTHAELTGGTGNLKETLKGLDLLKKHGVMVTTNSVATPINYYDIPDVWRYSTKMGFTPFVARNHYHGATRDSPTMQLSAEELKNLFHELQRIDVEELKLPKWPADVVWPRANSCQRYRAGVFVNHRGIVTPCSEADPKYFGLGDVRKEPLWEILSYASMKKVRNIYDKLHGGCSVDKCEYSKNKQCYGCRVSAADVGLFRGKNFDEEFFGGDPLCFHNMINPLTAKEIGRPELKPNFKTK